MSKPVEKIIVARIYVKMEQYFRIIYIENKLYDLNIYHHTYIYTSALHTVGTWYA
jgi:hypothetical protein